MRGTGRVGGRTGNVPRQERSPNRDLDPFGLSASPFGELPVSPQLVPINDEWSYSDPFEPVDPRDCSKFPASPYCGEVPIRFPAPPVGFDIEIRSNECTTCIYVYPVVGYLMLTPTIVCKRDPNCKEDKEPPIRAKPLRKLPRQEAGAGVSQFCADFRNLIIDDANYQNEATTQILNTPQIQEIFRREGIKPDFTGAKTNRINISGYSTYLGITFIVPENTWKIETPVARGFRYIVGFEFPPCPDAPNIKPPPPPPPPINEDDNDRDRKKKKKNGDGGKDMCCNECRDASDKTDRLIKELNEIKKILGSGKLDAALNAAVGIGDGSLTGLLNLVSKRIGVNRYPIEVPQSLLTGVGDKTLQVQSLTDFQYWFVNQIDALVGEFPIEIEVKDIDPLREGDQKKRISLPNIAEAIAETYGLTIKSSVNQELELNMLLRMAAEIIATKNGVIVAQDYARANATFLGYKGNYKARETVYNFDFASVNLDPKNSQPIVMEKLLKTNKGYVQGWENEDKETAVGFLQKLMFAAGIIKAVFFRGNKLTKQFNKEATSMVNDAKTSEKDWENFLRQINNENSMYNAGFVEKPDIKEEPKDPRNP